MTLNLHFEDTFSSLFDTSLKAFKSKAKDISNSILISLITSMNNQNRELKNILFELEKDNSFLINVDLDSFYQSMDILQNNLEVVLTSAKKHRDKSDIFNEFYNSVDSLYSTVILLVNEVGFHEVEISHHKMLENAS